MRPGLTTMDLEKFAEEKIAGKPGKPAFKGYRGYPCTLCTSVNSEIVHGIPSPKRKLREGDIVSIDFGMEVNGYFADSAVTVPVGQIAPETAKLLERPAFSMIAVIESVQRAAPRRQAAPAPFQRRRESNMAHRVVREFVGHGIGTKMHDEPNLPTTAKQDEVRASRRVWSSPSNRW